MTPAQLRVVADVADELGSGVVEVTSRANLQIRGLAADRLDEAADRLIEAGLALADPVLDARRAVVASPLAGHDPTEAVDVRMFVAAVLDALRSADLPAPLPAKFGVVIDGGGRLSVASVPADVAFVATRSGAGHDAGHIGWRIEASGLAYTARRPVTPRSSAPLQWRPPGVVRRRGRARTI